MEFHQEVGKTPEGKMDGAMQLKGPAKGNVVISWTGGKDSCYSCYMVMKRGYHVTNLLHFTNLKKTGSHEMNLKVVQAQSDAMEIPLIHRDFFSYEEEFKNVVRDLLAQGMKVDGAVFGHIETHEMLVDRICHDLDIELLLPLWKQDSKTLLTDMIDSGFEMVVVSCRDGLMGKEWLGRRIDENFICDLKNLDPSIDPCGENGEFHTLVINGPIFREKIAITGSEPVFKDGYWFQNLTAFTSVEK